MKKLACFILSLIIALSFSFSAYASDNSFLDVTLDENEVTTETPTMYGINLGGIKSSNLIENGSFENGDAGWKFENTEYTYSQNKPMSKSSTTYNVVSVDKSYLLENRCYDGIDFVKGEKYEFSFYIRNVDFEGSICVWLNGNKNKNEITQLSTSGISKSSWTCSSAELTAAESENGTFAISFEGNGTIEIDFVSLVEKKSYGYKTDSYKGFGIRQNVFDALQNVKPAFMSFSVSEPSWKNTIGSTYERENSELGLHEYLQLCSDLNAIAIPVINASKYDSSSDEFKNYKQDILDLIEYANANWATSYYGSLRSSNGSQEPFNLKYVQLLGDDSRYEEIKKAIENKYSSITVLSEGDIKIVENGNRDLRATLDSFQGTLKDGGFVMFGNCFNDFMRFSANEVSYSASYFAQMLLSNNQGSKILASSQSTSDVEWVCETTIDQSKNAIYVSVVNTGSAFDATIRTDKLEGVTSASIQYVSDGYLSAYNDIGKQYIAPEEKEIKLNNDEGLIEVKIPQNSVSVVRITFNNASDEVLFRLPESIDLKAKNYVPPVIIAVIIALAAAIPVGTVVGFVIYKKVISKKTKEETNE